MKGQDCGHDDWLAIVAETGPIFWFLDSSIAIAAGKDTGALLSDVDIEVATSTLVFRDRVRLPSAAVPFLL